MEQEGIYYFFKHENGKHTLVLADSASAHKPFPGYERRSRFARPQRRTAASRAKSSPTGRVEQEVAARGVSP